MFCEFLFKQYSLPHNYKSLHKLFKLCNSDTFIFKVTGYVHISTQKTDVKVAKIVLEVTGTLNAWVKYYPKNKKTQVKLENVSY